MSRPNSSLARVALVFARKNTEGALLAFALRT